MKERNLTDIEGNRKGCQPMDSNPLTQIHPVIADWFTERFGNPTDVQNRAWPSIQAGKHTLIAAPTGSGKTLAALLPCLDRMARAKLDPDEVGSREGVRLLYITPLKALNNDIHLHIGRFVEEIAEKAAKLEVDWPELRVGVRTGDTSQSTRASMLRKPPEILVTTPESFYLLLTSIKGRDILKHVEQIIVDEIHDLAADKRGVHLSLTMERLVEWCGWTPQRIGVSATQKPMERMARFLGGWESGSGNEERTRETDAAEARKNGIIGNVEREPADRKVDPDNAGNGEPLQETGSTAGESGREGVRLSLFGPSVELGSDYVPRAVNIIESPMHREFDIRVMLAENADRTRGKRGDFWKPIVDRLMKLMEGSEATLIFVNSRRLCERLTLRLNENAGYELARSHHGSVSREKRLEVERALKAGELRCLVATSSLELGIDVGQIDLVVQIDSPKQAAAGIQRIGRAGHAVGGVSRGVILARSRGELLEAAVLARAVAARDIEEIRVPRHSLDVLSQQLVAMAATDDWESGRLAAVLARSDCYRGLPAERLAMVLQVLSGLYPFARPLLAWNPDTGLLHRRSNTSMAAVMGAGTIPQSSGYPVHHAETRLHLGELDEEFIHESRVGDVFQLGTSSWTIRSIRPDRVYVTEAKNAFSEIPFWKAEALGRSYELSREIGSLMERLDALELTDPEEAAGWLEEEYRMDAPSAAALVALVKGQRAALPLPTSHRIVIEHYTDDTNRHHVVIHSLFGRRFNRTWLLALRAHLERSLPVNFYSNAKDNGIEMIFPDWDPSWMREIRRVGSSNLEPLLLEAIPGTPSFGIHFRQIAEVSLLLSRGFSRVPAWKKRMRSEELLKDALPFAGQFPFLRQAMDESLQESLETETVRKVLQDVERGEIELMEGDTRFPSPFAAQFLFDYVNEKLYESDVLTADLQIQLAGISKELAADYFGEDSLRQTIPDEIVEEARKQVEESRKEEAENPEEIYALLKERGDLTREEIIRLAGSRAEDWLAVLEQAGRIIRMEIAGQSRWICSDEREIYSRFPEDPASELFVLKRFIDHRISFTREDLSARYGLPRENAERFISGSRQGGLVEQAPFAAREQEELWTSSKVASRIVRFSIREFRRQAEAVPVSRYAARLAVLHGLGRQKEDILGSEGLREIIALLQGIFLPVSHWEKIIFPARIPAYRREDLDLLCASGEVLWLGRKDENEKEGRIAFFLMDAKELIEPLLKGAPQTRHPELLAMLRSKGASFLTALSRDTGLVPSELLEKLFDLVWEGHASNDQFAPLRMQGQAKAPRPGRKAKFQSGLGRWYALTAPPEERAQPGLIAKPAVDPAAPVMFWTRHLLKQFGMITKDVVAAHSPFPWELHYTVLKKLEEWGTVTRGFFVEGITAMQYALRETVEELRRPLPVLSASSTGRKATDAGLTLVSAVDPANPFGVAITWPDRKDAAFARKPGNFLIFQGGRWFLWLENNGKRVVVIDPPSPETESAQADMLKTQLPHLFRTLLQQNGLRKVVVEQWNGERVDESPAGSLLEEIGAERDRHSYVLWPSSLK